MERVAGVLRLQPRVFEDIEADGGANGQALGIVVLSSLAAGVGGGVIGGLGGMVAEALGAVVVVFAPAALEAARLDRVLDVTVARMGEMTGCRETARWRP